MPERNLPLPADPLRAGLLLAADAIVMMTAALDELAALLEPERVSAVRGALAPVDVAVHELRRRLWQHPDARPPAGPGPEGDDPDDDGGST